MHWERAKSLEVLQNEYFHGTGSYHELRKMLETEAIALCEKTFKAVASPYWFTDHGPAHSDAVLSNALRIAGRCDQYVGRLNAMEAQALAYCCYLHDLCMAHVPSKIGVLDTIRTGELIAKVRQWHVKGIFEVLPQYVSDLKQFHDSQPLYGTQLPLICAAHGTDTHVSSCSQLSQQGGMEFRGDLLGKVILLADELDLAHHRCVTSHPQFEEFPISAKAHHFRHHYVVDVEVELPRIRIRFAFPSELGREGRNSFIAWTCGKIREMIELVRRDQPAINRATFDFDIQAQEVAASVDRKMCPPEVVTFVRQQARRYRRPEQPRNRPNHFHPDRDKAFRHGPFYPHLDLLVDEFFREGITGSLRPIFGKAYVLIDDNERCARELQRQLDEYCRAVRNTRNRPLPPLRPFVVTGVAGVGKTALVEHMRLQGTLSTRLSPAGDRRIVVHVDCRPMQGFAQVARAMLGELVNECSKSRSISSRLDELGFDLRPGVLAAADEDVACDTLNKILAVVHRDVAGELRRAYPVCFVLDNLDLARGMEIKEGAYVFAKAQGAKGYPFFVVPLRPANKRCIEAIRSDIAAIPENRIRCPSPGEVIGRRLEAAFEEGKDTFWRKRPEVEAVLRSKRFKPEDLRESLRSAMRTLCEGDTPFIPSMSGSNMRNALTLFRTVMKYSELSELWNLARGSAREHYLIRCAALEGYPSYSMQMSNLRNVFDPTASGSYFAKTYALRILAAVQESALEGDYVEFGLWADRGGQLGLSESILRQEAWSMLVGEFALVEALSYDTSLPDGKLMNREDLVAETEVRLSPAGKYYLDWLIHDFAYLQCILQDTSMPEELARRVAVPWRPVSGAIAAVEEFLQFLDGIENTERSAWTPLPETPPVIPQMRARFERQRRSLQLRGQQQVE